MKKYIKPETELIKLNTQGNILLAMSDVRATEPASAPRYYSDDEDETDATGTSW